MRIAGGFASGSPIVRGLVEEPEKVFEVRALDVFECDGLTIALSERLQVLVEVRRSPLQVK